MRARPRRARRVREVRRRRRPARLRDGDGRAPAPPVAVARMLGRRLPGVLLVHCRHALARARLARIARLRRRLHGLPGRRRVARAAGQRHCHLEDGRWWWGRVAGRARAREVHACGETTPRVDSVALDAIDAAPKRRIVATIAWRSTPSTRPPNDTGTAPAAASRRDSRSKSASLRAAASTRACDASATAAACDVHGASRASRRRAAAVRAALTLSTTVNRRRPSASTRDAMP